MSKKIKRTDGGRNHAWDADYLGKDHIHKSLKNHPPPGRLCNACEGEGEYYAPGEGMVVCEVCGGEGWI